MTKENGRGGQAVAETEVLQRPYFRLTPGSYHGHPLVGTRKEVYQTRPSREQVVNALKQTIWSNKEPGLDDPWGNMDRQVPS
jgi:hypothetical protein